MSYVVESSIVSVVRKIHILLGDIGLLGDLVHVVYPWDGAIILGDLVPWIDERPLHLKLVVYLGFHLTEIVSVLQEPLQVLESTAVFFKRFYCFRECMKISKTGGMNPILIERAA